MSGVFHPSDRKMLRSIGRAGFVAGIFAILIVMLFSSLEALPSGVMYASNSSNSNPNTQSGGLKLLPSVPNDPENITTYGTGLSGAPVILDESTLASMVGGTITESSISTMIQEHFVPLGIHLVFLDMGWFDDECVNSTYLNQQVTCGPQEWVNQWLYEAQQYGIDTIFATQQWGYYSSQTWDDTFLEAYPGAETYNASGTYVPISGATMVQQVANTTTSSTVVINFPANVASGDSVIVAAGDSGTPTVSSITDTQSNLYSKIVSSDTNHDVEIWKAAIGSTGPDKVAVSFSSSSASKYFVYVFQVHGISSLRHSSTGHGSGTVSSVSSIIPGQFDFVMGITADGSIGICQPDSYYNSTVPNSLDGGTNLCGEYTLNSGDVSTVVPITILSGAWDEAAVDYETNTGCAGCVPSSGFTITQDYVYRQMEQDMKQFVVWYGNYSDWIGFGEGAGGDRNYYGGTSSVVKDNKDWSNETIDLYANSIFFQREVNSSGYYIGTNTLSDIWQEFVKDRPDILFTTGVPFQNVNTWKVYGGTGSGGNIFLERLYVPFGMNLLNSFSLRAFVSKVGSPSSGLSETIYRDNNESSLNGLPDFGQEIASATISGSDLNSSGGWVPQSFSGSLGAGDYYWVLFSTAGGDASDYYAVQSEDFQSLPDIYVMYSTNGLNTRTIVSGGSILWLQTSTGTSVTVYPEITPATTSFSAYSNAFDFSVSATENVNMVALNEQDRAYDPSNTTISLETMSGSVLSTGILSLNASRGTTTDSYTPIQLSPIVTLTPGEYQLVFGTDSRYSGVPVTGQEVIGDKADPSSFGYLGQAQWPVFQLGLMNIEPQGISNFGYISTTDLQDSPGNVPGSEDAVRFLATTGGNLQSFAVNVIGTSTDTSGVLNVSLRADNETTSSHPGESSLAFGTIPISIIQSSINSSGGGEFPYYFANVSSWTGSTSLTAGNYYWIVMNATHNDEVQLLRLVSPYFDYVITSRNNFAQSWGTPGDGPTDLSFAIVTSTTSYINTLEYQKRYTLSNVEYLAQSFTSSTNFQLKGAWIDLDSTGSGHPNSNVLVEVRSDNGSDGPSSTVLATGTILATGYNGNQGLYYVSFDFPLNITASTKYWLVEGTVGSCVGGECGGAYAYANVYRADGAALEYQGTASHYEVSTNGGISFSSPDGGLGDTIFVLAASTSTIKTYNTSTIYSEMQTNDNQVASVPIEGFQSFLNYEQISTEYNLTQLMQSYGKSFVVWSGIPPQYPEAIPGFNATNFFFGNSGAGGPIGCPPSDSACGGFSYYWFDNINDHLDNLMNIPQQSGSSSIDSFGTTYDNQGDLTPTESRTYYLSLPMTPSNPLSFNDWCSDSPGTTSHHCIYNMTQTEYADAFGNILNRMQANGGHSGYFGNNKNVVKVLWIGNSGDGLVPEFITSAVNVTYIPSSYTDIDNLTAYGTFSQFNVIVGSPSFPTVSFENRLQQFVKNGGGYIDYSFNTNSYPNTDILGMSLPGTRISPSSLTIATPNAITNPYTSINYNPYFASYLAQKLSNESPTVLVTDQSSHPIIWENKYFNGIGIELPNPATSRLSTGVGNPVTVDQEQFGAPRDSWVGLLINAIFVAAGEGDMLPIQWNNAYGTNGVQNWSPYLQYSIDGTPGEPVLLWLSSNDSATTPFNLNLNATFYGINTNGWVAINMLNMSVIAKGSGSDIDISTTIPPYGWLPIYIMNDTASSNLQVLYSTASIMSTSTNAGSETLDVSSPADSSNWLIASSSSPISSMSSSLPGLLSSFSNLPSLNATIIGYTCNSVSSNACTSFTSDSQEGWFYDSTNGLLYVHYEGSSSTSLTIYSSGIATSSASSASASSYGSSTQSSTSVSSSTSFSSTSSSQTSVELTQSASTMTYTSDSIVESSSNAVVSKSQVKQSASSSDGTENQSYPSTEITGNGAQSSIQTVSTETSSTVIKPVTITASNISSPTTISTIATTEASLDGSTNSSARESSNLTGPASRINTADSQISRTSVEASNLNSGSVVSSVRSGIIAYEVAIIAMSPVAIRFARKGLNTNEKKHGWRW